MREANVASLLAALRTRLAELGQQHWAQAQIFIKARQRREVLEHLRLRSSIYIGSIRPGGEQAGTRTTSSCCGKEPTADE